MVHAMQNRICTRGEIGTSLPQPGEKIEKLFPIPVHDKHLVCCVAVKKEALAEQRKIPMQKKEDN
jgi:hypothetical protein